MISRCHGIGAAREEGERGADVAGSVMEGAAQRQLLVVEPVRVDAELGAGLPAAEVDDGAARADELERPLPRLVRSGRLDHDVGTLAVAGLAAELRDERAPLGSPADDLGTAACIGDAGAQHQPDRAGAEDRDPVAGRDARTLDAAQAARERLDHRRDLGREPRRHGQEVDRGDLGRNDEQLRVGAVQELDRRAAVVGRRRVGGDDALPGGDVDPAELVPERARQLAEEDRVAAPEGLQVGAVRERDLDLDEHVAGSRLRVRHLLQPQVARAVEAERPHGVKTTLSAPPER